MLPQIQRFTGGLLIGLWVCSVATPAAAQGGEESVPIRAFGVRDVSGWIEFEYEDEEEERRASRGAVARREERMEFSEVIRVNTRSYIYHPYMADLFLSVEGRARQGEREITPKDIAGSEGEDLLANALVANVTLLKRKPVVTNLFFSREVEEQDIEGFGSFEIDAQRYGTNIDAKLPDLPMHLSASRSTVEGLGASPVDEETDDVLFSTRHLWEGLQSDAVATYRNHQDHFRGTRNETLTADLRQFRDFGANAAHTWSNQVRYLDQRGTTNREQVDVADAVTYALTDRWTSNVGARYNRGDFDGVIVDGWSTSAGLSHHLYESLTTSADVRLDKSESDLTESTTRTGDLRMQYRKRVPAGRLMSTFAAKYIDTHEESEGLAEIVNDEPHTFGLGAVLLGNPAVLPGSVVITDATGVTVFVEGIDYLLLPRGVLTEVVRLGAGGIPPNETILADYRFTVSSELDSTRLTLSNSTRLSLWKWLQLYGKYETSDAEVTGGESLGRVQDRVNWLVGAEANYWRLVFTTEYEFLDAGLVEFDRQHARVHYTDVVYRDWQAFGSAAWTRTRFPEDDENVTALAFTGGLRGSLLPRLQARVDGWVRTETGRELSPDTDVRGVRATFEYRVRQVSTRLSFVSSVQEDAAGQLQERQSVNVSVRRWF